MLWFCPCCSLTHKHSAQRSTCFLQAPPNLTPETDDACQSDQLGNPAAAWSQLLAAGINDWGGISPLTRDWVNPEKPVSHEAWSLWRTVACKFMTVIEHVHCLYVLSIMPHTTLRAKQADWVQWEQTLKRCAQAW